jgi:hypothetical protein
MWPCLQRQILKREERFFVSNYDSYGRDCYMGRKGVTAIAVRKR